MAGTQKPTDNLWEAMSTQRALRRLKPDPVPEEHLWKLVEMATRAPSGSNAQPWRFIIITDPARKSAVAKAVRERYEQNEGMRRYFESGAKSDDPSVRRMLGGAVDLVSGLDKAPVLIIPVIYRE